ncbi:MAG: HD domain-containing protein [Desulfurococcaceae archaeon]
MNALEILENIAKAIYDNSFDHGLPHVERVLKWTYRIIEAEKLEIDEEILRLSVYLHDIGRVIGEPHGHYSMMIAEELMREIGYNEDYIMRVLNAIAYHSFSFSKHYKIEPLCEEAKILSDADKIDALGIVGLLRVFSYSFKLNRNMQDTLEHFYEKIFNLEKYMHYNFSKRIARVYITRIKLILRALVEEISGVFYR